MNCPQCKKSCRHAHWTAHMKAFFSKVLFFSHSSPLWAVLTLGPINSNDLNFMFLFALLLCCIRHCLNASINLLLNTFLKSWGCESWFGSPVVPRLCTKLSHEEISDFQERFRPSLIRGWKLFFFSNAFVRSSHPLKMRCTLNLVKQIVLKRQSIACVVRECRHFFNFQKGNTL